MVDKVVFIAGFWYGDGGLRLNIQKKGFGFRWGIYPFIQFINKDFQLQSFIASVLEECGYSVSVNEVGKEVWEVKICTFEDVVDFADIMLNLPGAGKKRRQLEIFMGEFVPLYESRPLNTRGAGRCWTKEIFMRAMEVYDKISALKGNTGGARKYNTEYFRKLWKM